MKYFGTLKSFDTVKGLGEIKQEAGGDDLHFEKSAIYWDEKTVPAVGQRLSYERGNNDKSEPRALNLQTI